MKIGPFFLVHDTARANAVEAVRNAPDGYRVDIKEPKRTLDQNAMLHPIIREWGNQLDWKYGGLDVDLDDLKVIAMSAYRKIKRGGNRFVIGLQGEPVDLQLKTSGLSKSECSELIEMIKAIMAGAEV